MWFLIAICSAIPIQGRYCSRRFLIEEDCLRSDADRGQWNDMVEHVIRLRLIIIHRLSSCQAKDISSQRHKLDLIFRCHTQSAKPRKPMIILVIFSNAAKVQRSIPLTRFESSCTVNQGPFSGGRAPEDSLFTLVHPQNRHVQDISWQWSFQGI